MKTRIVIWLVLCIPLLLAGMCDEEGSVNVPARGTLPDLEYLGLVQCTGECWQDLGEYLGVLIGIFKYIDYYGPLPDGVTYSRVNNLYNFELDLDNEPGEETLVNGEILPGMDTDLSDGFDLGEVAAAHWVMRIFRDVADYDTTGEGYFSLWRMSPTAIRMTIVDPDRENPQNPFIRSLPSCELELTSFGVHFDSLRRVNPGYPLGRVFTGITEFKTRTIPPSGDAFSCLATMDTSDTVTVNVNFNGEMSTLLMDKKTLQVLD